MTNPGLQILARRHPGVELLFRPLPNGPEGWMAVEAYDTPKGATSPCYHWYVVSPTGRVWASLYGERRTVELPTAACRERPRIRAGPVGASRPTGSNSLQEGTSRSD